MQCKDFEAVLEQEGLAPLPLAARSHLANAWLVRVYWLISPFIVSSAKELSAEVSLQNACGFLCARRWKPKV